jgi:HD-GYP domain-containing protein (c-di-GMP phosphodiesterase class II)
MSDLADAVLYHHERWDGLGYPKGISGDEIPLKARIITVADAFDAMVSERSYKKSMTTHEALEELKKNAGTQFDEKIVRALIESEIYKKI